MRQRKRQIIDLIKNYFSIGGFNFFRFFFTGVRFVFFVILFFTPLMTARADQAQGETLSIADKNSLKPQPITRGSVASQFLEVGFSSPMLNEDTGRENFSKTLDRFSLGKWNLADPEVRQNYEDRRKWVPWLADHVFLKYGLTKQSVVHRWKNGIEIAYGWPAYNLGDTTEQGRKYRLENGSTYNYWLESNYYDQIKKTVNLLLPGLSSATGLPVQFMELGDERDLTPKYARLRLLPVKGPIHRSLLRMVRDVPVYDEHEYLPTQDKGNLWNAVISDNLNAFIDIYLLPSPDESLDLTLCSFSTQVPEIVDDLIAECVVRSLGLPGLSQNPDSIFAARKTIEDYKNHRVRGEISPYDEQLIRTLYSPEIKSGMDKKQVIAALLVSDKDELSQLLSPGDQK